MVKLLAKKLKKVQLKFDANKVSDLYIILNFSKKLQTYRSKRN